MPGTSLSQWLRPHAPNTGDPGSIPGQGTRSHMLQLRVPMLQLKILGAATKTKHSQINKNKYLKKNSEVPVTGQQIWQDLTPLLSLILVIHDTF